MRRRWQMTAFSLLILSSSGLGRGVLSAAEKDLSPPSDQKPSSLPVSSACSQELSELATRVKSKLQNLGPLPLDTPTIAEGIYRLGQDLQSQGQDFQKISQLENDLFQGRVPPQQIEAQAHQLLEHIAQQADPKLNQMESEPQLRREVEGHRLLMKRAEKLMKSAQYRQTQEGRSEMQSQDQSGSGKEQKDSASSQESKKESSPQNQPGGPSNEQSGEPQKESESGQASNAENQMTENSASPPQSGQAGGESSQQNSSPQNAKNEGSQENSSSPQKGEGSEQAGKSPLSSQDQTSSQSSNPSNSDQGAGQASGSQTQQEVNKPLKASEDQGTQSQSPKTQHPQQIKNNKGQSSKPSSEQSLAQRLKDRAMKLFEKIKGQKSSPTKAKPETEEQSSQEQQNESKGSPSGKDQSPKTPEERSRKNLQGAGTASVSLVLKQTFSDLWVEALRKNTSSQALLDSLIEYARLARTFHGEHPDMLFLEGFAKRAEKLFETIEALHISYKDPEEFLLSQIGRVSSDPKPFKTFLEIQKLVYDTLRAETKFTPEESQVYDKIVELLKKFQIPKGNPTENQIAETFMNQLMGPLSKAAVRRAYPGSGPLSVNVPQLVSAIQGGQVTDLLIMSRLKPYLRIARFEMLKPMTSLVNLGPRVPISDSDVDLAPAEDLQNRGKIYRDGPLRFDTRRLLAEDLSQEMHRDPISKNSPKDRTPFIVDIPIYDISGSMSEQRAGHEVNPKARVQTYLLAGLEDDSQIRVAQGKARHLLYRMPFDGDPKPVEILKTLDENQRDFDRLRQAALTGSGGTQISIAVLKALSLIKEQASGPYPLRRGNIFLITDGQESGSIQIDAIIQARKQIDMSLPIAFHVITLGEGNEELRSLASQPERIQGLFQYSYQHLSYEDLNQILDPNLRIEVLEQIANLTRMEGRPLISNAQVLSLKQAMVRQTTKGSLERISVEDRKALLHLLHEAPKFSDASAEAQNAARLFEPVLKILHSSGVRDLLFEAKFRILQNYVRAFSEEAEISEDILFEALPTSLRMRLEEALNFPEDHRP